MKKDNYKILLISILCLAVIQNGTIRRKDDPIAKTKTNPIAYKDKLKEIKNGIKGAPKPSIKFYGNEEFLTEDLVEKEKPEELKDKIPNAGEPIPENLKEEKAQKDFWWFDEKNKTDFSKQDDNQREDN